MADDPGGVQMDLRELGVDVAQPVHERSLVGLVDELVRGDPALRGLGSEPGVGWQVGHQGGKRISARRSRVAGVTRASIGGNVTRPRGERVRAVSRAPVSPREECVATLVAGEHFQLCNTRYAGRMTMLSFRVSDAEAAETRRWADALGVDRSELLREALHRHLVALQSERDASAWAEAPATPAESSLGEIADWGPAEDWSDWDDAAR